MHCLSNARNALYTLLLWGWCQAAVAQISRPGFVEDVGKDSLEAAGGELYAWIAIAFAVLTALAALWPAFLFIQGRKEEGWDATKNVLIGAAAFVVLGTLVFGVIGVMS